MVAFAWGNGENSLSVLISQSSLIGERQINERLVQRKWTAFLQMTAEVIL